MVDLPHVFPGFIQVEDTQFKAAVSENTMQKVGQAINAIIDLRNFSKVSFNGAQTVNWTVPAGVTSVWLEGVGGGGGAGGPTAGAGGDTTFNGITVCFGATYPVNASNISLTNPNFNTRGGDNGTPGRDGESTAQFRGGVHGGVANASGGGGASSYGAGGDAPGGSPAPTSYGAGGAAGGSGFGGGNGNVKQTLFITGLTPGAIIPIVVGAGGSGVSGGGSGADGKLDIFLFV